MSATDLETYDAAVVGGGPAGLSAASWIARYRRRVVVVDAGEPRNRWVDRVHGYLAGPDDPREIINRGHAALVSYPWAEFRRGRAAAIDREADCFLVRIDDENGARPFRALRVVLATGVADEFPDVKRFFEHYGADVFHCPTCDGYEASGRTVAVLGWGDHVPGFAIDLLNWAEDVRLVMPSGAIPTRAREALDRHEVQVVDGEPAELIGRRGALEGVRLRDGRVVECDLGFFSIAHRPHNELAAALGCQVTEEGCVRVDHDARTTVEGVYAAGDLTPGLQLVQVAAAKGAVAGTSVAQSLQGETGAPASPAPAPDPEAELP